MSQSGITEIKVNQAENSFTVKPIDALYRWKQLQTKYDSSVVRESYLKKIIKSKDEIIASQKIDNTQLRNSLIKVQPDIDKAKQETIKVKEQNVKLKLGVGGLILAVIIETIILLK